MLHAQLAALALAATTLAASGCGGSSKTTSTDSPAAATTAAQSTTSAQITPAVTTAEVIKVQAGTPLSRTVWIAKGDAICARTNTKLSVGTAHTTQQLAQDLPRAASYDHTEAMELSKIVPPADKASDWQQVITGFQKFGELTAQAGEELKNSTFSASSAVLIKATAVQRQATIIAMRDGFKQCSQV